MRTVKAFSLLLPFACVVGISSAQHVGAPTDGRAWTDSFCIRHAIRGGAWNNIPIFVRSAARVAAAEDGADQNYDYSTLTGFRIARDLP